MVEFVATLLAPLFLVATGGDPIRAQIFARESIYDYNPTNIPELLLAAQAIGLGIAAIAAIGESATPDLPEKQVIRLRSQADRLSRSAARCCQALSPAKPRPAPASRQQPHPAAQPQPATQAQSRSAWAAAMEELAAELAETPNAEAARQTATLRSAAQALRQPSPHAPPR